MAEHNEVGKKGEDLAVEYLEKRKYLIFDRNYQFEKQEIDIVAYQAKEIVFVEVKTRTGKAWALPEMAVTEEKKKNLFKVARAYLYERRLENVPARFDVISVFIFPDQEPEITHFVDAFR
jgi:putative endonuclease